MLRVLHLISERGLRGGENQVRELCLQACPGLEQYVLAKPGARLSAELDPSMVASLYPRPFWQPLGLLRAIRWIDNQGIQIIDAHSSQAHQFGLILKSLRPSLKLIVHRRVDYAPSSGYWGKLKYLSPKVDAYVAISDAIKGELVAAGIPESKIRVIKSAVHLDWVSPEDKRRAKSAFAEARNLDPQRPLIIHVGHMSDQKDHVTLLKTMAALAQQWPEAILIMVGDGPLRPELESLAKDLGIASHCYFEGFKEDVKPYLNAGDYFLFPSKKEGLGTSLLDAIAAGLAVVATRVGGIPEIIIDGETGLLNEVGDSAGLARSLLYLRDHPAKKHELVQKAERHLRSAFKVESMAGGNFELYFELAPTKS